MSRFTRFTVSGVLGIALCLGTASCGRQAFKVGVFTADQKAPGNFVIPPKVDILLAEDDTGSMFESFEPISNQIPFFLQGLENLKWNYRFATTPLTSKRPIQQVIASKFDANWAFNGSGLWLPPFPEAAPDIGSMVDIDVFTEPDQYSELIQFSDINNTLNQYEPGFETIRHAIENEAASIDFFRPDAMAIVLTMSNGNDSSGVEFCERDDGWVGPCEEAGFPEKGTAQSSYDEYLDFFRGLVTKEVTSDFKMFSAIAFKDSPNCLGGHSYLGKRYLDMALDTFGNIFNICEQPIPDILSLISEELEIIKLKYRTRYLIIGTEQPEPAVETIQVLRYKDGLEANKELLPNDPVNGWTYEGLKTVFVIDAVQDGQGGYIPTQMNEATGYAIRLNGDAVLEGDDTGFVEYTTGGQPAAN